MDPKKFPSVEEENVYLKAQVDYFKKSIMCSEGLVYLVRPKTAEQAYVAIQDWFTL